MIDRGLLLTMVLMAAAVGAADRRIRRMRTGIEPILALASTPVLVGLAVGRLAAVILDDPATLRRPFDLLLIRGGVEFWPGVAAGLAACWLSARRDTGRPFGRLAELAPFGLWAYATYEAACLLRDGCFGPPSAVGLRPGGTGEPQVPVGVLVGLAVAVLGAVLWRRRAIGSAATQVVIAVTGLAAIRAAAGFLLPNVAAGLTRPHRESLVVAALGLVALAVLPFLPSRPEIRPYEVPPARDATGDAPPAVAQD